MQLVNESNYDSLVQLIKNDIDKCLYIYMNLKNYKKEKSQISVYVDDINNVNIVIVEYHNSYQVYEISKIPDNETKEIIELIKKNNPKMISGTQEFINRIYEHVKGIYSIEQGGIFLEDKYREIDDKGVINRATLNDAKDIAELIALDSGLGSHYEISDLEKQIRSRILAQTGRSYIIRDKEKIVAHTATYAECDSTAVVSGTIIHPEYRDRNYYLLLSNYIVKELSKEGKRIYTFAVDEKMYKYHSKVHKLCGNYARIKLKGEKDGRESN